MKIKKRLVALLAGISLLSFGVFMSCDNPSGIDKKDETEITNTKDGEDKKTTDTEKSTDKDKTEDKKPSSDKDKNKDKQNDSGKENSTETDDNGKEKGGESEGEESDVAEETTLSVGNSSIAIKSTAEGIRFEWDKLPENTEYIEIQTWWSNFEDYIVYYRCQNPSEVKSFIDEYVTADEEYKYKILIYSSTGLINKDNNEIKIKSKGGHGEALINIEATDEGIKLSGKKQLDNSMFGYYKEVKGIKTYGGPTSTIKTASDNSFEYIDKYVDVGEEYEYTLFEAINDVGYPRYKKQIVKAIGGLGSNQIKLTATPTEEGIKFAWDNIVEADKIRTLRIVLKSTEPKGTIQIHIHDKSALSFIAKYVDTEKEYSCGMEAYLQDGTSLWSNSVVVTTTGGSGEGKLLNTPAATFDGAETIHFTVEPQISLPAALGASCDFEYCDSPRKQGNGPLYSYYPESSDSDVKIWGERTTGTWNLQYYCIHFNSKDYEYSNWCYDVSKLNNIPQTIILTAESRFSLIATPVSEGIKLEWKNLPEGTKKLRIDGLYKEKDEEKYRDIFTLFEINNLSEVNSVIDKYVDSGKSYSYELIAIDENGRQTRYTYAKDIVAKSGSGEKNLTAIAKSDGIYLSFEKPASGYSLSIKKRLSEKPRECNEWIEAGWGVISESVTNLTFTDSFVIAGKEYIYSPQYEFMGAKTDDIIEIPRYKIVKVSSINTGEKPVVTNKPEGTYDETIHSLSITSAPVITQVDDATGWKVILYWSNAQNSYSVRDLFDLTATSPNSNGWFESGTGTWNMCAYRIWLYYENSVKYVIENTDITCLSGLPQTLTF